MNDYVWKNMEDAPRDGTHVLLLTNTGKIISAISSKEYWISYGCNYLVKNEREFFDGWMPIPWQLKKHNVNESNKWKPPEGGDNLCFARGCYIWHTHLDGTRSCINQMIGRCEMRNGSGPKPWKEKVIYIMNSNGVPADIIESLRDWVVQEWIRENEA